MLFIAGKLIVSSGGFNLSFQQLRFQGGAGKRLHRVLSPLLCPARSGQCCQLTRDDQTKGHSSTRPSLPEHSLFQILAFGSNWFSLMLFLLEKTSR